MNINHIPIFQLPDYSHRDPNWVAGAWILPPPRLEDPRILGFGGRDYQLRCYEQFHGKNKTIFISPTGSGKSLLQVFCAAREIIESDYQLKQLILVPQLNIGNGFTESKHAKLNIGGEIYDWRVSYDCCKSGDRSVSRIREFLLSKKQHKFFRASHVLGGVTAVSSYTALIHAWKTLTAAQKREVIRTTSFRPDETHHLKNVGLGTNGEPNELSKVIEDILDHAYGHLHLTTATFFRGDRIVIIKNIDEFEVFRVPFMEHWHTLGLREMRQEYRSYVDAKDLLHQLVAAVKKEKDEYHLIILPSDGHKFFRTENKLEFVRWLVAEMEKIFGTDQILDLITPERQKQDKQRLVEDRQKFRVAITCMIGREGTDWPPCSRIHNTVLDANVLQPIQKLGRSLRGYEGKVDVVMTNYIEHFDSWNTDPKTVRERLSDRFNAMLTASMIDDMIFPILMPTLNENHQKRNVMGTVTLEDIFGENRNNLIEDLMRQALALKSGDMTGATLDDIIEGLLDSYETYVEMDPEVLVDRLRREVLRRFNHGEPELRLHGLDISFVRLGGWDRVVREHIAPNSPFKGGVGTRDLESLQTFLKTTWEAYFEEVIRIGVENVNRHDHPRLYNWMLLQRREFLMMSKAATTKA